MLRRSMYTVAALVLLAALFAIPKVAGAHHGGDNTAWASLFTIFCNASHVNNDDPITGVSGTNHQHQYFGAKTMFTGVTEAQAEAGGSTCFHKADTTGYWVPSLLNSSGVTQTPPNGFTYFYYYCVPVSGTCVTDQTIPDNLKVIWGTTVGDPLNNVGGGGSFSPAGGFRCAGQFYNRLVDCAGGISIEIIPPPCWDGVNLDSANHRSHMSYLVSGACPASHPVKLPMPHYFINFPSITNADTANYRLSSDAANCATTGTPCGGTLHADFWNTWNQPKLDELVTKCTQQHVDVPESVNDMGCRLLEDRAWSAQTQPIDYGLMTNGGFENGLTGWTVTPAGAATVTTGSKNTGTNGVSVNFNTSGSRSVYQEFTVTPGETVCVSGNIYPQSNYAVSGGARFDIMALSTGFPRFAISPKVTGSNSGGSGPGEFKHLWAQGVVPAGTTSVRVLFYAAAESDLVGQVFVDDISFFRSACPSSFGGGGEPPPPPPPPPTVVTLGSGDSELRCSGGGVPVVKTTNPLVVNCP